MTPEQEKALIALKPQLSAIETVKYPNMPIATFANEANALTNTYLKHTARYGARGIDTAILAKKLETSIAALVAAEYQVRKALTKESEAKKVWDQNNEAAHDLLDEALSCLDYTLPANSAARRELESILEGSGNADFIMDLGRTAVLCREHAAALTKVAFTETMTDQLQEFYTMLSEAYGMYSSDKKDTTPEVDLRNRVYSYSKEIIDEIKRAAKMVFRKEPEMLAAYRSEYKHLQNLKRKSTDSESTNPVE